MIASTQTTTTEIFGFIAVIIFRLLSLKVKAEWISTLLASKICFSVYLVAVHFTFDLFFV